MTHSPNEIENIYFPNEYESDHGDDMEEETPDATQVGPSQAKASEAGPSEADATKVGPSQASSNKSRAAKAKRKQSGVWEHFNRSSMR